MINTICNGRCHIDEGCLLHNPIQDVIYTEVNLLTMDQKRAVKCPICMGAGALDTVRYGEQPIGNCHGCDSKGWVAV